MLGFQVAPNLREWQVARGKISVRFACPLLIGVPLYDICRKGDGNLGGFEIRAHKMKSMKLSLVYFGHRKLEWGGWSRLTAARPELHGLHVAYFLTYP